MDTMLNASPLLVALAPYGAALKLWINKENITKQDCENYIDRLRRDLEKQIEDKESYIQAVDKKANENGKEISNIQGKLDK